LHDYGLERLNQFPAQCVRGGQQHPVVYEEAFAPVGEMIPPFFQPFYS
jgi:hypothetical protein